MRHWIIVAALGMNALVDLLVPLKLWYQAGWGRAVRLSTTESRLLILVAVAALALNLVLVPVLGIQFLGARPGYSPVAGAGRVARAVAPPTGSAAGEHRGRRGPRGLKWPTANAAATGRRFRRAIRAGLPGDSLPQLALCLVEC